VANKNPADAAAKWRQNLSGASEAIAQGVGRVTVAPGQAAARQKGAYQQGVAANVDKWASRVGSVSLSDWQRAMTEKGAPRIATGAQAAEGKVADFLGQFIPHMDGVVRALPPRGGIDANIQRMIATVRGAATFKRR